jgi:hypothetical protein
VWRRPAITPGKPARARIRIAFGLTVLRLKVGKTALYQALGGSAVASRR